jgi:hypothetical protein
VFNEEDNVDKTYAELKRVAAELDSYRFEFLFTDNHSTESTFAKLAKIAATDPDVRVVPFIQVGNLELASCRRLEMRGVKLGLGHGETLIVLSAPEQVGCRFLDTHDLRDISDIQGSSKPVVRRTGSRSASPPDKTDIARSAQHRRA